MFKLSIALAASLLAFAPAMAQTAADAPVASADKSLDAQISAYLDASPQTLPAGGTNGAMGPVETQQDRKVHGEVGVGVGTGGYREAYASMVAPVGQTGTVAVAVDQTRGRGRWGPVNAQSLSIAASMGAGAGQGLAGSPAACATNRDRAGFQPLWVSRLQAASPAAAVDCPALRP